MNRTRSLALGLALAASVGTAQAGIIDFTSSVWQTSESGDTASSKTRNFNGVDVTVRAFNASSHADLTFTSFDGAADAPCGTLLACDTDGAGIEDDEVSFGVGGKNDVQRLLVTFSEAITIDALHFFDLSPAGGFSDENAAETAQWQINGNGAGGTLDGYTDSEYGAASDLGYFNVNQIEFFADTLFAASSPNTDFAVAAISTADVPEPATLSLLGLGLAGLVLRRKAQ